MLEDLIRLIHFLLIGFVLITPFTGSKTLIKINIVLLAYLSLKWLTGYDKCGLTELEYAVSNKPYGQGFLYRFLDGVFKMKEAKFNIIVILLTVIWLALNIAIAKRL
jgi:hypothetical protein